MMNTTRLTKQVFDERIKSKKNIGDLFYEEYQRNYDQKNFPYILENFQMIRYFMSYDNKETFLECIVDPVRYKTLLKHQNDNHECFNCTVNDWFFEDIADHEEIDPTRRMKQIEHMNKVAFLIYDWLKNGNKHEYCFRNTKSNHNEQRHKSTRIT